MKSTPIGKESVDSLKLLSKSNSGGDGSRCDGNGDAIEMDSMDLRK